MRVAYWRIEEEPKSASSPAKVRRLYVDGGYGEKVRAFGGSVWDRAESVTVEPFGVTVGWRAGGVVSVVRLPWHAVRSVTTTLADGEKEG